MSARWRGLAVSLSMAAMLATGGHAWADNDHKSQHHEDSQQSTAFNAVLTFDEETPTPPTPSSGEGLASFLLSHDGTTLYYTLMATNTTSAVTAAHIHQGRRGESGPVIVNLCGAGSAPACGTEGVIATGSIQAKDFVGPASGRSMADLIRAMDNDRTYTNIHTASNPGGELRGQNESVDEDSSDDDGGD